MTIFIGCRYIKNVVNTSRAEGFNDGLEQGKLEEKIATAIKNGL